MKLVIAEKKDVALLIGRAICGVDASYVPVTGNGYTVIAAQGHLLELVEPEAYDGRYAYVGGDWDLEDLPIFFENWKRDIKRELDDTGRKTSKPSEFAKKRVELIAELAEECDCIVNAGDPDDEGQCLVDEIIEYIGWTGPVERVYINDSIEKNVRREFTRLKDNAECRGDGLAAYGRSMADLVFGLNETRLIARQLGLRNVSLGRVQTPTLAMVVARDRAIEGHVEQKYYEASIELGEGSFGQIGTLLAFSREFLSGKAEDGKHVTDRDIVEASARKVQAMRTAELTVTRKDERKAPPLPYNITQLEGDMNRRYGYPSTETLAITQALRDKYSAITYNRTSSSYLKEEHFDEARAVLGTAMGNIGLDWPVDFGIKGKAFDDSKVTAHHGIIPQEIEVDVSDMTEAERRVYTAIVERYAMQFLPPALYDACRGEAPVEDGKLVYTAKRLKDAGWKKYAADGSPDDDADDGTADGTGDGGAGDPDSKPMIPAGVYSCTVGDYTILEKTTTPPKRYTEETLLADMTNAAKFVKNEKLKEVMRKKDEDSPNENGSIGTSATRHTIIDTLKKRGFIEVQGKKNIVSTERGRALIDVLPEDIKAIDTTAVWWLLQEEIRNGRKDVNDLPKSVAKNFVHHKKTAYTNIDIPPALSAMGAKKIVGKCPRCGANIVEGKGSYQCQSNKFRKNGEKFELASGCGWSFTKLIAHKKLTSKQGEALIAGKRVLVRGMKAKSGKTFDAYVKVTDLEAGKVEFSFEGLGGKREKKGTGKK